MGTGITAIDMFGFQIKCASIVQIIAISLLHHDEPLALKMVPDVLTIFVRILY